MVETSASMDSGALAASRRLDPFGRSGQQALGITAVLTPGADGSPTRRALAPLLRAVEQVIVVDHGAAGGNVASGAADAARAVAAELGLTHRLQVIDYPFDLSPPGRAHLDTPPDSVHSLVHFHNWAFSHVRTTYALRWDHSLALTPAGEALLADFNWQVGHHQINLRLPRHPLYVESDRVAYLDLAWANLEHRGHPAAPGFSYVKGFERPILRFPEHTHAHVFPPGTCLLLRDLHGGAEQPPPPVGSGPTSSESRRERYEADTVRAIRAGRWQEREGLHRIEAPAGTDVVDHAAAYWTGR